LWREPEAHQFAAIAVAMGVPEDRVLVENRSTNTGENVLFTKQLLAERGLEPHRFIVVQKAVHGAPQLCDVQEGLAGQDLVVTSPQVSMDDYLSDTRTTR